MNNKKITKQLTVTASHSLSPNMQRIEFTIADSHYFLADCAGQYVKLMFTPEGKTDLSLLGPAQEPVLRTYTIRDINVVTKRLVIDFVKHQRSIAAITPELGGYGQHFAEQAKVGDHLYIRGPGSIQAVDLTTDWLLLVADMTSIPALSVMLDGLPEDAQGYVVLEVASVEDLPTLTLPPALTLVVCVRGQAGSLADRVRQLSWLAGQVSVWCACEFSDMKAIRSYVTHEHEVERAGCYFSSYWKEGVTEDGHKLVKQQDKNSAER